MPNTADYLNQLIDDRNDLADNLVTMGVAASHSETFTALVPKVLTIPSGSVKENGSVFNPITLKMSLNFNVKEVTV